MPKTFEADACGIGNDQMVMQGKPHHRKRLFDIACDINIGA
jgi:hypothetical protein